MNDIARPGTHPAPPSPPAGRTCLVVIATLLLLVAAAALPGCGSSGAATSSPSETATGGSSGAAAPEVSEVTLIMDWVPWVLDIPVDVAQDKGFYADHGLTVKQTLPAGATDVAKFVSTGKAQFGLYYAPDTLMGVAAGAPLLSVASLMSHAPVGMALAPGVHAQSPSDLAGTTAGVVMIPSTRASFATMLKAGGVDPGAVKVADPGFDIVAPLLAGKYDSVAVTEFGELVQADAMGQKLDYLDFRDWGTPDYALPQRAHPEGVRRRASGDGQGLRGGHAPGPRLGRCPPRRGGGAPGLFCAGVRRPAIFVTRGALDLLNPGELQAALAHELAHLGRRNPERSWVMLGLRCLMAWNPTFQVLTRALARDAERLADERAVALGAGRLALASALLKLHRATGGLDGRRTLVFGGALAGTLRRARSHDLELRVRALLEPAPQPLPWPWVRLGLAATSMTGMLYFVT